MHFPRSVRFVCSTTLFCVTPPHTPIAHPVLVWPWGSCLVQVCKMNFNSIQITSKKNKCDSACVGTTSLSVT